MEQLNAHDAMFAYFNNENWGAHGGIVAIYDPSNAPGGRLGFSDVLAHVERRLPTSPIFRRRMVRVPLDLDNPYWVEDEHFDIEYHVRHVLLSGPADWRTLCDTIARLDSRPLDLNRPLWEMYVIEGIDHVDGIPTGSFAIFTKLHHAAVDGHSMRDIVSGLHDFSNSVNPVALNDTWSPDRQPSTTSMLRRAAQNNLMRAPLRTARAAMRAAGTARLVPRMVRDGARFNGTGGLIPTSGPRTRFQQEITPHRVLDGCRFPLDDIRQLRTLVPGATVNDVVVTVVGGGVRRYLEAHREPIEGALSCGAPIDLRKGEDSTAGNDIAFLTIALGAEIADPVERLARVRQSTAGAKEIASAVGARELSELSASFPGALNAWGFKALAASQLLFGSRRPMFNVGVSNVPGPPTPLYFNGARLERIFGVAPIFDGTALVFGVFSYCDSIDVTFVSCRRIVPDPAFLAECVRESFGELRTAAAATRQASI